MKHLLTLAVALAASLSNAGEIGAQPLMARSAHASAMYVTTVHQAGMSVVIETSNLSPGADTVVHVLDASTGVELARDDDSGPGRGSRVVVPAPPSWVVAARALTVVVRADDPGEEGTADLLAHGSWHRGIPVGGTQLAMPCDQPYEVDVVAAPGSSVDTFALGLSASGELVALDDDGGVGEQARLQGAPVCTAVVGSLVSDDAVVRVYANDVWTDEDGDGLGAELELALGTCGAWSGSECDGVWNAADTDRDGLDDGIEVLGRDGPRPQYLPAWGSDPRHKDVFVELDRREGTARIRRSTILEAAALFAEGSAEDLRNPDGLPGVRLHVDIGRSGPAGETRYGDWGGADRGLPGDLKARAASELWMASDRRGLFRYALLKSGSGGKASGATFNTWDDPATFAHELGHTLNLGHEGHPSWGRANCKPNYVSLMNYAYKGSGVGFSHGPIGEPLNPAAADEWLPLGDTSHGLLGGDPWELEVWLDRVVDLDGSGDADLDSPVRAPLTWTTGSSCAAFSQGLQSLQSGNVGAAAPVVVRRADRLYAFWLGDDGVVRYRHGVHNGLARAGCFDDALDGSCMDWSPVRTLPLASAARGFDVLVWNDRKTVIAYRSDHDRLRMITARGVDAAGSLGAWTEDAWLGHRTEREPELAELRGPFAQSDDSRQLALIWVASSDGSVRMRTSDGPLAELGPARVQSGDGAVLTASQSPTVIVLPGVPDSSCGAFADAQGLLSLRCFDGQTGTWPMVPRSTLGSMTTAKPGLAYHRFRRSDGSPATSLAPGRVFFTWTNASGGVRVAPSEAYEHGVDPEIHFWRFGWLETTWTKTVGGTAAAFYEDEALGGLKGMLLRQGEDGEPNTVDFLPLADGSFDEELRGGSDFRVMERGICLRLRGAVSDHPAGFCGPASSSVWGY